MSNSRLEKFIYAICSMEVSDLPAPLSRIEILWNCLITGETPDFEPQSRNEQYLMAMLGLYELENLPTPMSRGEKLLYKIAMGETDLSDIPAYLSRYEELLGYLAENGGVGDFEYILQTLNQRLSMLYSTKERPMKQAVIKGDTLVNELPRPSLKNAMTNVASQKLNQGYDSINVVDGEFKSAILSGKTEKIIVGKNLFNGEYEIGFISLTKGFVAENASSSDSRTTKWIPCKANTTYVCNSTSRNRWLLKNSQGVETIVGGTVGNETPTVTTLEDTVYLRCYYKISSHTVDNIQIEEGSVSTEYEECKEELVSVKMPVLTTTGKNLLSKESLRGYNQDVKEIDGWLIADNGGYGGNIVGKALIEKGKTYTLSTRIKTFDGGVAHYCFSHYGKNDFNYLNGNNLFNGVVTFTATETTYIDVWLLRNGVKGSVHYTDVQLEEGSVATSYEPHKTNILSISENVTLRKVGDVEDEFDALTGQVTERVGEIVLDGNESWTVNGDRKTVVSYICHSVVGSLNANNIKCSEFPTRTDGGINNVEMIRLSSTSGKIIIHILKSKIGMNNDTTVSNGNDATNFKQWLSQNPIRVQYELKTPVMKTVSPTITDQDGATQTKLHSFNDGYLSVYSQGLLPSAVNYEVPTNNSYYLPDMLTLGAQYTSRGSADCNATIDGKLLALGKNRTFTTPSTLTNRLMVLDAAVDDLMFIKGDQTAKDFGHFEGMKSVEVSGIKVTGKNLFDETKKVEGFIPGNSTDERLDNKIKNTWTTPWLKAEPNTNYIIKGGNRNRWQMKSTSGVITYKDSQMITTSNDIEYIRCYYCSSNYTATNVQIERGSVETPYEPYKSTTLTLNEPVTLRKVGDVQDTLDGLTGEVTERIGEIVLDGSENWLIYGGHFYIYNENVKHSPICISNWLIGRTGLISGKDQIGVSLNNGVIRVNLDGVNDNVETLKDRLKQNPLIIQYPLATPVVKTVDLTTVDQDGQPTKLKSFNDVTYVEINADNIIPSVDVEVATKISETLATLDPQHHDISETQNKLGQTIDEQAENTDATMMATTEIYEQTL